jgi:hypothetical protein
LVHSGVLYSSKYTDLKLQVSSPEFHQSENQLSNMSKLFIAFFCLISVVVLADPRRQFGVTFPKNTGLPENENDAKDAQWVKIEDSCDGVKYVSPQKDYTNVIVYDKSGKLAGVDVAITVEPAEPMKSRFYKTKDYEGRQFFVLSAFFVDPSTICGTRSAGPYGDRVWWRQNDGDYFKLPLTQDGARADPKWKLGTCIPGMGIHYWYEISNEMSCNDFTPFFVMYNGGELTTFAVGFGMDRLVSGPNNRFEHAPKFVVRANFRSETLPQCLMKDEVKVSTMHFFWTSMLHNRCQSEEN